MELLAVTSEVSKVAGCKNNMQILTLYFYRLAMVRYFKILNYHLWQRRNGIWQNVKTDPKDHKPLLGKMKDDLIKWIRRRGVTETALLS